MTAVLAMATPAVSERGLQLFLLQASLDLIHDILLFDPSDDVEGSAATVAVFNSNPEIPLYLS